MPRVGRHPLKVKGLKIDRKPQEITVATITHIPMLAGYWEESLEVLKLFFQSLFASTNLPFDLMVFDNGSCEEVQDYLLSLRRQGMIQYLIFCDHNLGKLGALNFLLSVAPGEYIAYADSDVYFLSGWLEASLEVLKVFPEAGQVTASPLATNLGDRYTSTLTGIESDPSIKVHVGNNLIPKQFILAHCASLGLSYDVYLSRIKNRRDILIARNGKQAFVSAADFQFVTTQKALHSILPLTIKHEEEYFDAIYSPVFEIRLNEAGFWRLSTTDYLVHHMGNRVPDFQSELPWVTISPLNVSPVRSYHDKNRIWIRLMQRGRLRNLVRRLHLVTYQLLYGETR